MYNTIIMDPEKNDENNFTKISIFIQSKWAIPCSHKHTALGTPLPSASKPHPHLIPGNS